MTLAPYSLQAYADLAMPWKSVRVELSTPEAGRAEPDEVLVLGVPGVHDLHGDEATKAHRAITPRKEQIRHPARAKVGEDRIALDDVTDLEHDGYPSGQCLSESRTR